ncbi:MAG TPA: LamG-like jellyroll fold domain-containing protein [Jiangellales bacterium]|nr:LamG-like jellyroll fold domain-containing protein [Jiangellales bacterium]
MAAGLSRPDVYFGLALNVGPNDPYGSPVWIAANPSGSPETFQLRNVRGLARGRQYELDAPQAADPLVTIRDPNEYLNAENPSSPYVNLVQAYREALMLAQWPITPAGAAVTLFNVNNWKGNKEDAHDGSFESFTAGQEVSWALPVGATDPLVGTTTPQQGTKDLTWTVAANTSQQGFSWPVACIPGRQYTASVYARQSSASTQRISVTDQTVGADPFNTTNANGWGADMLGHTWTPLLGAATVFSTAALTATIAPEASTADRIITVDTGALDHTVRVRLIAPDPATIGTNAVTSGVAVRVSDANNYLNPIAIWRPEGVVGVATFKRVGGVRSSVVAEVATGWVYTAGQEFVLEVSTQTLGTTVNINSRLWPVTKPKPSSFHNAGTATDAALLGGTRVGPSARVESTVGITLPFTTRYAAFSAVGYVHGSTTAATGAYNRVSVTWTATQPQHLVQLATTGTAVAGTVLADAIQHEQGAAASTYNTDGPSIYPIMRNSLEQFARTWLGSGFEGQCVAPAVDGLSALQSITIASEYPQAVLNTGPDRYWRLNDGTETGLFADTSGAGGIPLTRYVSKYGAGTDIEPGSSLVIAGNPEGTGVGFTQTGAAGSAVAAGTALGTDAISWPAAVSSAGNWAMSFSCWATLADLGGDRLYALCALTRDGSASGDIVGFWAEIDATGGAGTETMQFTLSGPVSSGSVFPFPSVAAATDGLPHHYAFSMEFIGANTTLTFWFDGAEYSTTFISSWPAGTAPLRFLSVGLDTAGLTGYGWNGVISDFAMWDRKITSAEVSAMFVAGATGFAGETSGSRIVRHLALGQYHGPSRISVGTIEAPGTTMQAPTWTGTIDLTSDSLNTTTAEQGTFWVAPDGYVTFETRQDRWLRLEPSAVIGEDSAGGEIPYLMQGARFTPDPLYTYANVQIGRNNGSTFRGGDAQSISIATRLYWSRTLGPSSFDFEDDQQALDMADYTFYTHRAPLVRVDELVIDPAADDSLWPFVLGLEIGKRVTAIRRAKAANAGAGIVMEADYFVEKITIEEIDFDADTWLYRVQLSPIGAGNSPEGPTLQPWILEDAVYGVLDQTTVLGW